MDDILKRLEARDIAAWDDAYSCRARGAEAAARIREPEAENAALREARGVRPQFPILRANGAKVDLQLVVDHGKQADANHRQSVKRLAERGGLSWSELYAVLHNKRWQSIDENEAMVACRALEARYLAALEPAPVTPAEVWQPIETAPKDGLIDVWLKDGVRWADCYYDRICGEWRTSRPSGKLLRIKEQHVSHWMPSPTPPFAIADAGEVG